MPLFGTTMDRVIFYSWQSDLPNATNRGFIHDALEKTAKAIASDSSTDDVPIIDRDTKDIPGAPHIAKTILEKIAAADVLVADVSIVQGRDGGRPTPNPNVLVELGYALCSLSDKRIILIMNTASGAPEDLPFDLRMHRVMTFNLPESSGDRTGERSRLQKTLEAAIKAALASGKPRLSSSPSRAVEFLKALTGPQSSFFLADSDSKIRNDHYCRFTCAPDDEGATRALNLDVEEQFYDSIIQAFDRPWPQWPPTRSALTIFNREESEIKTQRLALTRSGALGLVTLGYIPTDGPRLFLPTEFLYDLACFYVCAALVYKKAGYTGGCLIQVELNLPAPTKILERSTRGVPIPSGLSR